MTLPGNNSYYTRIEFNFTFRTANHNITNAAAAVADGGGGIYDFKTIVR